MSATDSMPCPRCHKQHQQGEYVHRPKLAKKPLGELLRGKDGKPYPPGHKYHGVRNGTPVCPPDVQCDCGATLRYTVPLFKTDPYGWHWRIL